MRFSRWTHHFRGIASILALVSLSSCDGDDTREIGGGYRMKRSGNPTQFALVTPHDRGGLIIDEIGWRAPMIAARASGSQYWEKIDSEHAQHTQISDQERKTDPALASLEVQSAETAWEALKSNKRLW
ncbi:MAG: hypothetical protein ABJB69_05005 [Spartobacteria bacterium]